MITFISVLALISVTLLYLLWFGFEGKWYKLKLSMTVVLGGAPILIIVIILHNSYRKEQLSKNGVTTYGVVFELVERSVKRSITHFAKFTYKVDNKTLVQEVRDNNQKLNVTDSLKLLCSTEDPEIFEVVKIIHRTKSSR